MPLKNYSMLKGRPINNRLGSGANPHYQVLVSDGEDQYRIAVNVESSDGSEVEFLVRTRFDHPITQQLLEYDDGLHRLPSAPGGAALDFIRANLAQPWEFKPLPLSAPGPDNDLNEKVDAFVQRAMADEGAMIYAFGESWGPETKADKIFGFRPGRGIHDIHFNQGNPPGRFAESNGPWQDGGLIFHFPRSSQWSAVFLKFQTQSWHSDDRSGEPIVPPQTPDRDRIPPFDAPDGLVRIVAALVNDVNSPEREMVTLLNTSDVPVDLSGWTLRDKNKNAMPLSNAIAPGATLVVNVAAPVSLSNRGGLVTLVDGNGVKVHGVSYTREQARQPGRTIPFQQ
ncbi:DUF2278 family protein [Methylocystis rosea]|uniref:DUF2278 family protein n=1 Tax=Methylocystis rosea TaxID=173366 RepID=A0ABX6EIC2_9HYPH|nr:DUF2278 family protein [Methylocystis rosea]QGM94310.1 DUF2278 family protein [Methylocystis rosea]